MGSCGKVMNSYRNIFLDSTLNEHDFKSTDKLTDNLNVAKIKMEYFLAVKQW